MVSKRMMCISLVIFSIAVWSLAWAAPMKRPAIEFNPEPQPLTVTFPGEYKDKLPAIYQSYVQVLAIPSKRQAIIDTYSKKLQDMEASKLTEANKARQMRTLGLEKAQKMEELDANEAELRNAFLFLAEDFLLENQDPYVLLVAARQFYDIRGQAPEIKGKSATPVKSIRLEDDEAPEAVVEETPAPTPEPAPEATQETTPAQEGEPEHKTMSYANNYERIIDYLGRIKANFPQFEAMDEVAYLEGATLKEWGKKADALATLRRFMKDYTQSPLRQEVLFRIGDLLFDSTTIFDHFDQAVDTYKQVAAMSKAKDAWYFRAYYKQAWSEFLSMNYTEDAQASFIKLFQELDAIDEETLDKEMLSIKAETKHLILQFKRGQQESYEFFK